MIPKIIHYCWFGHNPKPKLAEKCIKSWGKYCPDYEIIEWNEDNFDIALAPLYVRQAYEAKKWAFVTDYVRLDAVYHYGGIYLDTDVELLKNLDAFLKDQAYFGFEREYINTGLGFGSEKGTLILEEMMRDYQSIPFVKADGSFDTLSCPMRNTEVFLKHGLLQNGLEQILDGGIHIYPMDYFCPISFETMKLHKTKNTATIHWFAASWTSEKQKKQHDEAVRYNRRDFWVHLPNRIMIKALGIERYEQVKKALKGN